MWSSWSPSSWRGTKRWSLRSRRSSERSRRRKRSPQPAEALLETVSSNALSETPANAEDESEAEAEETTEGETAAVQLGKMVENERNRRATEQTQPPPARPRRTPFPPNLPREDNPISVPDAERPCPKCGLERRCAGHDVSEVLELMPARVIVRRDLREKLACDACDAPNFSRAPVGDRVVQGGQYGPRLVAQLLVDKYRDGLPLHRQRERYQRMSVDLSVSTLADQVAYGAELLQPLWRAAQIAALKANVLHLDGTSLAFFTGEGKDKKRHKKLGALWGFVGDQDVALYLFAPSGHATFADGHTIGPADFLRLRSGYTVADAATVFDQAFARRHHRVRVQYARTSILREGPRRRRATRRDRDRRLPGAVRHREGSETSNRENAFDFGVSAARRSSTSFSSGSSPSKTTSLLHCASVERSTISRTSKCR